MRSNALKRHAARKVLLVARGVITAARAAALLQAFVARRRLELAGPDLALTRIDFAFDDHVDALCRRLALEPDMKLARDPKEARVLLCCRIALLIHRLREDPDQFPALDPPGRPNDTAATAYVFALVLATALLPDAIDGQLFSSDRPLHLN